MVTMDVMWWFVAAGVAIPLMLAFLAGNCIETYRSKRLHSKIAIERRDIEDQRRELDAEWDELEAGWHQLEAAKAGIREGTAARR